MRIRTHYTTKHKSSKTLRDYLPLLENVSIKDKKSLCDDQYYNGSGNPTYLARCPLHINHPNGDRNPSFIISEGDRQPVVYFCMSNGGKKGKCSNANLTNWFTNKFKEKKKQIDWANNSELLNKMNEDLQKVLPYRNRLGGANE